MFETTFQLAPDNQNGVPPMSGLMLTLDTDSFVVTARYDTIHRSVVTPELFRRQADFCCFQMNGVPVWLSHNATFAVAIAIGVSVTLLRLWTVHAAAMLALGGSHRTRRW